MSRWITLRLLALVIAVVAVIAVAKIFFSDDRGVRYVLDDSRPVTIVVLVLMILLIGLGLWMIQTARTSEAAARSRSLPWAGRALIGAVVVTPFFVWWVWWAFFAGGDF